jgi:hypothetical protein
MATKRRGHGEGSIKQRADGLWEARVSLDGGKRKSLYGKTRKEAQDKLRTALRDIDAGVDLAAGRQTLGQFLDRWLIDSVKPTVRPKTFDSYAQLVRLYLKPDLGHHQLSKLTPQHVQAMMTARTAFRPLASHGSVHPGRVAPGIRSGVEVGSRLAQCCHAG